MRAYTIQKLTRLVLLSILTLPTSSTNDVVLSCSANCDNETDETLPLSCKELSNTVYVKSTVQFLHVLHF